MSNRHGKNRFLLLLAAIAFAGFLLRLIAGIQLAAADPAVFAPASVTDMATYKTLSEQILQGTFPNEFYYQPFYYAVFLPIVQILTGPSHFMVILAQSLCGGLAILLTGLAGARIAGKTAGIIAAILLALSRLAILYTSYQLIETTQLFWFVLLLYLTLKAMDKGAWFRWLLTGIVLSIAILTRGNAWCFLPPILLACFWGEWRSKRRSGKAFALAVSMVLLGTILPQIPFAAVNSIKYGTLKGPSTAGGAVLALGNTKESPPGGLEYPPSFNLWTQHQEERSVPMRILDWFCEEPAAYLELTFRKLFLYWNEYDIPNNINPAVNGAKSSLLAGFAFLPTGFLLLLCLAGVFMNARKCFRKRGIALLFLFLILYWLAAAAFYNLGRFRVPSFALYCLAGGLFCAGLPVLWRKKQYKNLFLYNGFALLAAYFIVYPGYTIYREVLESSILKAVRPYGVQVEFPGEGLRIYDHGPMSFGGWNMIEGNTFQKKFNRKTPGGKMVEFRLLLLKTPEPQRAMVSVNGQQKMLDDMTPGKPAFVKFRLPDPEDGIFRIDLFGPVRAVADLQRDYGRTCAADGSPLPYELLAELLIPEQK